LFVVFGHLGGGLPVFLLLGWFVLFASFDWLLGRISLICDAPGLLGLGCFCLESLILAQDERWRRA